MFIASQAGENNTLLAQLSETEITTMRGAIEVCDARHGISGWALDLSDLRRVHVIQLLVDDTVLASCKTHITRDDIMEIMPDEAPAGFRFPAAAMETLRRLAAMFGEARITLRVEGTGYILPHGDLPVVLGRLFPAAPEPRTAEPADLRARLQEEHDQAQLLAREFAYVSPDCLPGLIEVASVDTGGYVWVAGWMQRQAPVHGPAVLVDHQRNLAAGYAFAQYERTDVDAAACGFIGTLHVNWKPKRLSDPVLYLGEDAHSEIATLSPLRVITWREFVEFFEIKKDECHSGDAAGLEQLMKRRDNWAVNAGGDPEASYAALEMVLTLPGFGCLVSGWAISLLRPIDGFMLRLGTTVLHCDRDTLFFKPRPDVASLLPGCENLLARAGFTGVFRGPVTFDDLETPTLKLCFADGSSSNHAVDVKALRQLGRAVPLEAALQLYPALTSEAFFPDFAAGVRTEIRRAVGACRAHTVQAAPRLVVMTAPDQRSEMFLLFEELIHHAGKFGDNFGFAIIAGTGPSRSNAVELFANLQARTQVPCSLFFVDDPDYAFHVLPDVLRAVGARAFVFVGPGVFLADAGWQAVQSHFAEPAAHPRFFAVVDPTAADQDGIATAACFAWTTIGFAAWVGTAPDHIGAFSDEAPLPRDLGQDSVYPRAAWFSRLPSVTPLVAAINQQAKSS